jgi:transposase
VDDFGDTRGMSSLPITAEQLAALPPEFRALLEAVIVHYEARIAQSERRIAELEGRLGKSPQNSSLPPSTRHPHAKPPQPQSKSKKRRGGQPGHQKHERPLVPTDQCAEVRLLKPAECRRCGEKLRGSDPTPLRHQVWELPEIKPQVTEYQRHRLACPRCGERTCAELPAGVSTGTAGERLTALTALLMGSFRQSKSRTALFLSTVLGQPCSTGWVVKLQNQATVAVRGAYQELAAQLPREPVLSLDETPAKEETTKSWLWTYVAQKFTLFALRPSREASGVTDLLGKDFPGVVHCDRARFSSPGRQRQRPGQAFGVRSVASDARVVPALGRLSRRHHQPRGLATPNGARPPHGGTLTPARHPEWQSPVSRHVPRTLRTSPAVVALPP